MDGGRHLIFYRSIVSSRLLPRHQLKLPSVLVAVFASASAPPGPPDRRRAGIFTCPEARLHTHVSCPRTCHDNWYSISHIGCQLITVWSARATRIINIEMRRSQVRACLSPVRAADTATWADTADDDGGDAADAAAQRYQNLKHSKKLLSKIGERTRKLSPIFLQHSCDS